ncbi:unnamed protein product (mitochondrion) [Plasmodiophora brassicae]|uniref:A-kinase anchor protein 7-like phosphoesterase domain-containing protein n=1 Tax=Plasmodiophora brassicae TaxID=37360 RepID=A0A0G4IX89_PLABS|nr:hypothetical protein PBRA_007702 [Plasmodiophora brassicae]SPQ99599.1 unnamed protein product [Plasmodiophora brassicae]
MQFGLQRRVRWSLMLRAARSAALAEARNCKSAAMTEAETVAVGAAPVAAAAADAGTMVVEAGVSERLAGRDRGRHRKRKAAGKFSAVPPFTHFVSVPLCSPATQDVFLSLKNTLLERFAGMEVNLDDSVFVRACRLHFTIVMLRGLDDEARMRAVHDALESVRDEIQRILGNGQCLVRLERLATMQVEHPEKAHVIYAEPVADDGLDRLKAAAKIIIDALSRRGVLFHRDLRLLYDRDFNPDVKWHCTIINTRHRLGRHRQRVPVDARSILQDFGMAACETVKAVELSALSDLSGDSDTANKYYDCAFKIDLDSQAGVSASASPVVCATASRAACGL